MPSSDDVTVDLGVPKEVKDAIDKADAQLDALGVRPPPPDTFREEACDAMGQVLQLVPEDLSAVLTPEAQRLWRAMRQNLEELLRR